MRPLRRLASLPSLLLFVLAGCGSGGVAPTTSLLPNPTTTSRALRPGCPDSPPANDAACDKPLECEYGDTATGATTVATCSQKGEGPYAWVTEQTSRSANQAECPSRFDSIAANGACPAHVDSTCWYPEGACLCICTDQGKSGWYCDARASFPATRGGFETTPQTCP